MYGERSGLTTPSRLDELTPNLNRLDVVIPVRFLHRLVQSLLPSLNPCRIVFDDDLFSVTEQDRYCSGRRSLLQ